MSTAQKWLLRLGMTALGLLLTTDRRRPKPAPKVPGKPGA